jgi:acetolactate synthase-1/2/3 large subunit
MRGADVIARGLAAAGVEVIFSLSGNQIMVIYDACIDAGIRVIHVRHEAAAVYMAEAYAQLTDGIGVALVTAGPGLASAMGPMFTSMMSESPVLLLSGDSPIAQDGAGAFQELDQTAISAPLTKASKRPLTADSLGNDLAEVINLACSGRPGPVHLALPVDLLMATAELDNDFVNKINKTEHIIDNNIINEIIAALNTAERPLIAVGPALTASRIGGALSALADAVDAPVIALESPRGLRDPALGQFAKVLAEADVVVSIQKPADFMLGFLTPPAVDAGCAVIMIDPDPAVLAAAKDKLAGRLQLAAVADGRAGITALTAAGRGGHRRQSWRADVAAAIAARVAVDGSDWMPMHPATACAVIDDFSKQSGDCIHIGDGGEFGQWAQALVSAPTRIINGPSGSIGGGLCYAIAAKLARPEATVVVTMGDGSAGFHLSEFETAHRYGIAIIAVVGHDAKWNAEVQLQIRDFGPNRVFETELNMTRYDLAAGALGGHGAHVREVAAFDAALNAAKASGLPALVAVEIEGLPAPSGPSH